MVLAGPAVRRSPDGGRYYRDENRSSDEQVGQGRDVSHDDVTENEDDVLSFNDDVLSLDDDIFRLTMMCRRPTSVPSSRMNRTTGASTAGTP